jgi:transcriptional regulator with XRE-family HTH domain
VGRLSRALAAAAPPSRLLDALDALPDVAPGQLWRARRGSTSLLVLVIGVDGAVVELAPITIDDGSNADALDLPSDASELGAPLTVWRTRVASVPMRSLEQYIGKLLLDHGGDNVLDAVIEAGRPGAAAVSATDPTLVVAARMTDQLAELAAAPLPGGTGELPSLLKASGLGVGELGQLLGVSSATVLELRRGQRAISAEQAQSLAPRVGADPESLLAANPTPPELLVVWMSRPPQRRRIVRLAQNRHVDEDTAFADATYSSFALAARSSGDRGAESAWAELGERYLQSVLDES